MLVDRAALDRHAVPDGGNRLLEPRRAVDDEQFGTTQTTLDEIVEHRTPGLGALAAHALDCEQNFLAIGAYADDDEQQDRGRFAVEPHAHHGAVENEPHDRFIGQRTGIPRIPVVLHLAQTRLTVSLPTGPPNRAPRARRTRRVLVPAS
jgi:hypothetical protein